MISKYRCFCRNVDSLEDKGKKRFFWQKYIFSRWSQNIVVFAEMLIVYKIKAKNDFLEKKLFFSMWSQNVVKCKIKADNDFLG